MEPFRARYGTPDATQKRELTVEVIGFHCANAHFYTGLNGIPAYRLMMFHASVSVTCGRQTHEAEPHTLFVFPPGEPTRYGRESGGWSHSWIRVSGATVPLLIAEHGIPENEPIAFGGCEQSDRWLLHLHREMQQGAGPDPAIVRSLLVVWLREIRRHTARQGRRSIPSALVAARQYVQTHYLDRLRLVDLARRVAVSRQYLCEGFRQHFGVTPIEYAIRLRMQHAEELLSNADLNVTQVAERCGFSDVYYFSKLFKKRRGLTPSVFRRHPPAPAFLRSGENPEGSGSNG
ncbi:MAG: helix-turn-helix transcriptional regulator [Kiritimatiellae bacterium]|nr:helix-turn-helix transcriptional regulator [Kiritimatiellia bacterium]